MDENVRMRLSYREKNTFVRNYMNKKDHKLTEFG